MQRKTAAKMLFPFRILIPAADFVFRDSKKPGLNTSLRTRLVRLINFDRKTRERINIFGAKRAVFDRNSKIRDR